MNAELASRERALEHLSVRHFKPSIDLMGHANMTLGRIFERLPAHSRVGVQLERLGIGYRCRLRLALTPSLAPLSDEPLQVDALANDPKTAIDRLEKRLVNLMAHGLGEYFEHQEQRRAS